VYRRNIAAHTVQAQQYADGPRQGLHWKKVEAFFKHLGADVYEGQGSTVTFVIDGVKFTADRPHPRKECGKGLVKRVRKYLRGLGKL